MLLYIIKNRYDLNFLIIKFNPLTNSFSISLNDVGWEALSVFRRINNKMEQTSLSETLISAGIYHWCCIFITLKRPYK